MSLETDIQSLKTTIASIGNKVEGVLDIFMEGGVANADWATLKGELQGWTQTQLATKLEKGNLRVESNSSLFVDLPTLYQDGPQAAWRLGVVGKDNTVLGGLFVENSPVNGLTTYLITRGDGILSYAGLSYRNDSNGNKHWCFVCPPLTDYNAANAGAAINKATLNSLANSVVHKDGTEIITGNKTFDTYQMFNDRIYSRVANSLTFGDINEFEATYGEHNSVETGILINYGNRTGISSLISGMFSSLSYDTINNDYYTEAHIFAKKFSSTTNWASFRIYNYVTKSNLNRAVLSTPLGIYGNIYPSITSRFSCGTASNLWSEIYASTGTIQTSDENLKAEISDVPEAVLRAWGKVKFQQFKFKDAIKEKGINARIHMGVIAQRIQEAFQSEGLDARKYGLFCWDEWEDQYKEKEILVKPEVLGQVKVVDAQALYNTVYKDDGTEEQVLVSPEKFHMEEQVIEEAKYRKEKFLVEPAGSRYSVRYEECLVLECAYQRWRLDQLEAKIK